MSTSRGVAASRRFSVWALGVAAVIVCGVVAPSRASAQGLFDQPVGGDAPAPQQAAAPANESDAQASGGSAGAGGGAGSAAPAAAAPMGAGGAVRGESDSQAASRIASQALAGYSLMVVVPPKPRVYAKHDLIEIIVNENSSQSADQDMKTDKKYDNTAGVKHFPSTRDLLEMQLRNGDSENEVKLGINSKAKFDAKSEYERKDRIQDRITAEVVDVKPNGNLVLEARRSRDSNGQTSTIVMSGICRGADITQSNTIQSSQLADLTLRVENTGEVDDGASKGIITKVLDTLFNF